MASFFLLGKPFSHGYLLERLIKWENNAARLIDINIRNRVSCNDKLGQETQTKQKRWWCLAGQPNSIILPLRSQQQAREVQEVVLVQVRGDQPHPHIEVVPGIGEESDC